MQTALDMFKGSVPRVARCSNNLEFGVQANRKTAALNKSYIQYNEPNSRAIIMIDLDYDSCPTDIYPNPNILTYNKHNGRAHAAYMLSAPVHANQDSSMKALKYLAAAERALTKHLKGDLGFSHYITKNPFSSNWRVVMQHNHKWDLGYLCEYFNLDGYRNKSSVNDESFGFGRNCDVFHGVRQWAYIAIRNITSEDQLFRQAVAKCAELNVFNVPLAPQELMCIAKSVSKWVWMHRFDLTSYKNQSDRQSGRGKKSGVARREGAAQNRENTLKLLSQGLTISQVAEALNTTYQTVRNYVADTPRHV